MVVGDGDFFGVGGLDESEEFAFAGLDFLEVLVDPDFAVPVDGEQGFVDAVEEEEGDFGVEGLESVDAHARDRVKHLHCPVPVPRKYPPLLPVKTKRRYLIVEVACE